MKRHSTMIGAVLTTVSGFLFAALPARAGNIDGTVSFAKGTADLVVYVDTAPGTFPAPAKHAEVNQKGMQFSPNILTILVGTTVDFLNGDKVNHNVFSPDNEGYNLGTWPQGESRSYLFKKTGVYTQLCSIHPEMEAFIIVVQNPYFATTAADGHFSIANVPPGHYELKVWGKKVKGKLLKKTFPVDVTADGAKVTIAL